MWRELHKEDILISTVITSKMTKTMDRLVLKGKF